MFRKKNKRGEAYFDVVIGLFLSFSILALAMELFNFYNASHKMTYLTEQMVRVATMEGNTKSTAVGERYKTLVKETGLSVDNSRGYAGASNLVISFDGSDYVKDSTDIDGTVQLGKTIKCTTTMKASLKMINAGNNYLSMSLVCAKSGLSEQYWKPINAVEDYDRPGHGGGGAGTDSNNSQSASISVNPSAVTLIPGEQKSVNVTISYASESSVVWKSSNEAVAIVDTNGTITGVAPGATTVTATLSNGVKAAVSVTVTTPTNYSVSLKAGTGGTVTGGGQYARGKQVAITATPDSGYRFNRWSDGNTDATRTFTINSDITLSASFERIMYNVALTAGAGGSVSGNGTYPQGSSVKISASPSEGYVFDKWSDGNPDATRTLTMNSNITLTANFLPKYTVNLAASTGGTVSGSGTYISGQAAHISAIANTGYHFVKWSDGNTSASRSITITGNTSLTASFSKNMYAVTITAGDGGTASGSGTYEYGAIVNISATASTGYHFAKWSDGNTSASRSITVTNAVSLSASFAKNTYAVDAAAGDGGTTIGGGTYNYGDNVVLKAIANVGYHFTQWSDGVSNSVRSFFVTCGIKLTALFNKNQYTVTVMTGNGGTVSGAGTYNYGDTATVTATPNSGHKFSSWSDGNTSATRTLAVTDNIDLTASFVGCYSAADISSVEFLFKPDQNDGTGSLSLGSNYARVSVTNSKMTEWNIYAVIITKDGKRWRINYNANYDYYDEPINATDTNIFNDIPILCNMSFEDWCNANSWRSSGFISKANYLVSPGQHYVSGTENLSSPSNVCFFNGGQDGWIGFRCDNGYGYIDFTVSSITVDNRNIPFTFSLIGKQ